MEILLKIVGKGGLHQAVFRGDVSVGDGDDRFVTAVSLNHVERSNEEVRGNVKESGKSLCMGFADAPLPVRDIRHLGTGSENGNQIRLFEIALLHEETNDLMRVAFGNWIVPVVVISDESFE